MKLHRITAAVLAAAGILAGGTAAAGAQNTSWMDRWSLSGWADTVQSLRVRSPNDSVTSRARLRLALAADMNWLYGFTSLDAEQNWIIEDETGIDLHEAWLEHVGDGWDLRIGRQIIIWGQADGIQITDIISPPDYTESVTRDLDEIRQPVDAAKFRLTGERIDTELIWIPVFKAAVLPTGDNPWAVEQDRPQGVQVSWLDPREPDTSIENSEIALKIAAYLPGLDLAASVFYTWDDYAARHRRVRTDGQGIHIAFAPEYHRLTVFGLTFSRPWSDFVFRGEAAYYLGRYLEAADIAVDPLQRDILKWLGGVDWSPGNDWTLIAQLTSDVIIDHGDRLADEAHTLTATFNISKKLLRQMLTLSNMLFYSIDRNECYDRPAAEYAVTDALHVSLGADIFCGADGRFGRYQDNTQVWVKAKYSF